MPIPPRVITPSGPANAKVMMIGEAPGEEEQMFGAPFVGPSGRELKRMMKQAGLDPALCYFTNVFHCRPPKNDLLSFCSPKSEALPGFPPIKPGKYIRKEFAEEISRLESEIMAVRPNVIVALGNTALAALTGTNGIGKVRGTLTQSKLGFKILPTYHPAAVLRQWMFRVIVVADLRKVVEEQEFAELRLPKRRILINPTVFDLEFFYDQYLRDAKEIAVDIETKRGLVRCIGFAPNPSIACVCPFIDFRYPDFSYWRSPGEELRALRFCKSVLEGPAIKVLQNGSYDLQYLWKTMGLRLRNFAVDTTLAHHALYPELPKDLGFLGSVYTKEPSWKMMRHRSDELKKEE